MLPDGWTIKNLGNIADVSSGGTPSRAIERFWNGSIPWVTTGEIHEKFIFDTNEKITVDGLESSSAKLFPAGTLLMAMYGQGKTRGTVAKLCIEATTNQACAAIIPRNGYNADFLFHNLSYRYEEIRNLSNDGSQKNLSAGLIKALKMNLPPLLEQQRIAEILGIWDQAIETVEALIANSQAQKKALIQQLLTGKRRLTGFSGEWHFLPFNNVYKVCNAKHCQIQKSLYLEDGAVPIVDQGQAMIAGYTNSNHIYTDLPVIVFGDHTRAIKWVDFEFCPGADGTQLLKASLAVDDKFAYYLLQHADIPNLGYSRHMRELKEKKFNCPVDKEEQLAIADLLTSIETNIDKYQKCLSCLKQEKASLMQQLLTGKRRVNVSAETATQKEVIHA